MVILQITNMLPRYAITGLLLTEETNSPIAQNDKVISKQLTKADVTALRLISLYSITTIVCGMMVDSISNEKEDAARYFPITISLYFMGCVKINSIVPERYSSAHRCIVIPGIKTAKISG